MYYSRRPRDKRHPQFMRIFLPLAVIFLCCSPSLPAYQSVNDDEYRIWVQNEVDPIISEEEKGYFSSLTSDAERDKFVAAFWKSLDPTPGTETNEFKNEHYRRLQVAVTRFSMNGKPGTDTSRGKVYVKLGEPVQILNYNPPSLVSYVEAWFYPPSANCGIKYPFFVLFYIPEGKGQYEIFVPGEDDPYQLLATRYPGSRKEMNEYALKSLFAIDPVLGQLSLNLIPSLHRPILHNNNTELRRALSRVNPVSKKLVKDLIGRPYLDAEERLSRIIAFMDGKEEGDRFKQSSAPGSCEYQSRVYRNNKGNPTYFVSAFIPSDDVHFEESFGKCYSFIKVDLEAYDERNYIINSKTEYVSAAYSSWEIYNKSAPSLCYEGFLELPKGKYRMEVKITNHSPGKAFIIRENIEIPSKRESVMALAKPVVLLKHIRKDYYQLQRTYSFDNKDLHPAASTSVVRGQDAEIYYQLYYPRRDRVSAVTVKYMITYRNRVLWRGSEILSSDQLVAGSFFSRAVKFPIGKFQTGKYNLIISAKSLSPPETRTNLEFNVVNSRSMEKTPILANVTK